MCSQSTCSKSPAFKHAGNAVEIINEPQLPEKRKAQMLYKVTHCVGHDRIMFDGYQALQALFPTCVYKHSVITITYDSVEY